MCEALGSVSSAAKIREKKKRKEREEKGKKARDGLSFHYAIVFSSIIVTVNVFKNTSRESE